MTTGGTLTLFLQAGPPGLAEGGLGLSAFGASQSGLRLGVDLYAYCDESGNVKTGSLPLTALGDPSDVRARYLNLFAGGEAYRASSALTLYAGCSGAEAPMTLFASGEGLTDGAVPLAWALPLYLRSSPSEGITLFARGPGEASSSGLTLYTEGAYSASSGLPMFASGLGHSLHHSTLFAGGF